MISASASTRRGSRLLQNFAHRNALIERRGADDPERRSLEAYGGKHEPDGNCRGNEPDHAEVQKSDQVLKIKARHGRAVQRQKLEAVDIHDHERKQKKELGPLGRVAEEVL
jgi:hypothetical protein